MSQDKPKVFISYSHEDEDWKDLIRKYFDASELFDMWDDRDIELGKDWENEIDKAAIEADIAVLLISVDFLNSSFIKNKEVPMLLNKDSNIKIIPILLSAAPWKHHDWLAKLQGYPKNFTPLDSFKDKNLHFNKCPNVSNEINTFVEKIYEEYSPSPFNAVVVEENKKELLDCTLDKEEYHKVNVNNIDIIKDNKKLGTITIKTVPVEVEGRILNVSIYPVTFEEYDLFLKDIRQLKNHKPNDRGWGRGKRPVINVSWKDAKRYCKWLSKKNKKKYRLPSSDEWKNIAKLNYKFCDNNRNNYMWYGNKKETIEVDNQNIKPDILGLYNFYGNIDEWCGNGVARGGSFRNTSINKKRKTVQKYPSERIGFRVCKEV